MSLIIGLGDFATRISRALRVRGRIPTTLDANVVPVATIIDLSDPLYAQNPTTWMFNVQQAPGAGVNGFIAFSNKGLPNQLAISIDSFLLMSIGTTASTPTVRLNRGSTTNTSTASAFVLNQPAPVNVPDQVFIQGGTNYTLGGNTIFGYNMAVGQIIGPLQCGAILYPGDSLIFIDNSNVVTSSLEIVVYGRTFLAG